MLTQDRAADIFDRIKKFSSADEVEVLFSGSKFALTRFANNTIHQNVAEENYGVSVRTAFGGRTARASTNKLDDESLRRVVAASEELAKVQHPDPDLLPMPDTQEAAGGREQNLTARRPSPHVRCNPHKLCLPGILLRLRLSLRSCGLTGSRKSSELHSSTSSLRREFFRAANPSKEFSTRAGLPTGTSKRRPISRLRCWARILRAGRKRTPRT